jgi:hypothetical protein
MTAVQLTQHMNQSIIDLKSKSIDRSEIRNEMISILKESFTKDVRIDTVKYDGTEIQISSEFCIINAKVSTKSTGKIVKVTKLRNKEEVIAGQFKIVYVYQLFCVPAFKKFADSFKVAVCGSYGGSYGGDTIYIPSSEYNTKTFAELSHYDYRKLAINSHDKLKGKSLLNHINEFASRDLFNATGISSKGQALKVLPAEYKDKISDYNQDGNHFYENQKQWEIRQNICFEITMNANKELLELITEKVINNEECYGMQ